MQPVPSNPARDALIREAEQAFVQGRYDVTLGIGQRLLSQTRGEPDGMRLSGIALSQLGRTAEALQMLEAAVRANPGRGDVHASLATTLAMAGRITEAIASARRGLELEPRMAQCHGLLATLHLQRYELEEAEWHYRESISIEPTFAPSKINLGAVMTMTGRTEETIGLYRQLAREHPAMMPLLTNFAMTLNYATRGEGAGVDGPVTPEETLAVHRAYGQAAAAIQGTIARLTPQSPWPNSRDPQRRIRVGVLSHDLFEHSVASFLLAAIEHRDRGRVEYIAYMTSGKLDAMTRRLGAAFDGWRDVSRFPDGPLIEQIRQDQCDVLLELNGHTFGHKQTALSFRAAPVQATWCGYPNTTGNVAIDYRLIDSITDPPGAERWCTERLVRIDPCFLCFTGDARLPIEPVPPSAEQGFVTFGSFNAIKKLSSPTAELWASVLHAVPTSRLVIKSEGLQAKAARERVRTLLKQQGIPEVRVELVERMASKEDHLRAYGGIDIALDTFPYNGTTTTCEALWQGVPVVTRMGDVHASRVSASLLSAVGVPELIARDDAEFVRIAAELAGDPERLRALRTGLRARMAASPLCDGPAFARRFEAGLRQMWAGWCGAV